VGALVLVREQQFAVADQAVVSRLAVQRAIGDTLSVLKDAETGQRGFLLTGDEAFLAPYYRAADLVPHQLWLLRQAVSEDREQARRASELGRLTNAKLEELAQTIAMFRAGDSRQSLDRVREGSGRRLMVALRREAEQMLTREAVALAERKASAAAQRRNLQYVLYASAFALIGIAVAGLWSASRGVAEAQAATLRLRRNEEALRSLAENASDLVRVIDDSGRLVYVSPSCSAILGFSPLEMLAMPARALLPEAERDEARRLIEAVRAGESEDEPFVHQLLCKDGSYRWFETKYRLTLSSAESSGRIQLTSRDITARRMAEEALQRQTRRLECVLSSMGDGVVVVDERNAVLYVNPVASEYMQQTPGELISNDWVERHRACELDGRTPFLANRGPITQALAGKLVDALGLILHDKRGVARAFSVTARPIQDGDRAGGCVAVYHDITDKMRQEAELIQQAELLRALTLKDELTGLYNRRGFVEHAGQRLRSAARANRSACLFFVDLNGMKLINDSLGHEFGDRALTSAARVLSSVFRDSDIVSRLGGDEFAVLAGECGIAEIEVLRERLRARTVELNETTSEPFQLSMSVGAAVFEPGSEADLETLMERADRKMYEEKRAARAPGSDRPLSAQSDSTAATTDLEPTSRINVRSTGT